MQRSAKALTSLRIPYKAILTASTETRREVFDILNSRQIAEQAERHGKRIAQFSDHETKRGHNEYRKDLCNAYFR